MHLQPFKSLPILLCIIIPISLQQTQDSLDPDTGNDLSVLIGYASLPVTDSGDNNDNSGISFVGPNGLSGISSVGSTEGNEPQHLPNPTYLADDEIPHLAQTNPPCSFGNPMVPQRNGEDPKPLDPKKPFEPSKQLYCCTEHFLSCIKWFVRPHDENVWDFEDPRCDSPTRWSCCSGVKDDRVTGKARDGMGVDCEKATLRSRKELRALLQALRPEAFTINFQSQLPIWFKQYIHLLDDSDTCAPSELQPRDNMRTDHQRC